jgi:hypothetical protein
MAITAAHRRRSRSRRGVGPGSDGQETTRDEQIEDEPEHVTAKAREREGSHEAVVSAECDKKPIARSYQRRLLPGS